MKRYTTLFFLFFSLIPFNSTLAITYSYTSLIFLDYKDLKPIVNNSLNESRRYNAREDKGRTVAPLKKTLKMLLSRPDKDGLLRKLAPEITEELIALKSFDPVLRTIIKESKTEIYNERLNPKVRATALLRLNNLLLYIRPLTLNDTAMATHVCKLADDKMKIPKEVLKAVKMTTMFHNTSPVELAKKIMLWYAKQKGKVVDSKSEGCPFSNRA